MGDILDKLLGFLRLIGEAFLATITSSFSAAIKSVAENGGELLVNAANEAVRAAEQPGVTGLDKYEHAFEAVVKTLTDNGIQVVENAVNIAIENGVATLKEEIAAINNAPKPE